MAPQHVESSQTRDQSHFPCIGRQISYPLHQQGSSQIFFQNDRRVTMGFPGGLDGKESACSTGDQGSLDKHRRNHNVIRRVVGRMELGQGK